MVDYISIEQLGAIDPSKWLIDADIDRTSMVTLMLQANAALSGAAGPWYQGDVNYSGAGVANAQMELPPMPGIRMVDVGVGGAPPSGPSVSIIDETGTVGTISPASGWGSIESSRALDGWLQVSVEEEGQFSLTVQPIPLGTSYPAAGSPTEMELEGFLHNDRYANNRGLSVTTVQRMIDAARTAYARSMVYHGAIWLNGQRTASGTGLLLQGFPVRSRGRRIGLSVQGVETTSTTAEVRLKLGGEVVALVDGFPGSQGTIVRGNSTDPIPPGHFIASLETYAPAVGTLDLYSVSVYEYPDSL
jgi:hypothetical protein